jgi:hypothetical protein
MLKRRLNKSLKPLLRELERIHDLELERMSLLYQRELPNPLNAFGQKVFSQSDEDGITMEILSRIGVDKGMYGEYGVGDGLENNTLVLAALGFRGFWCGTEDLAAPVPTNPKFMYQKGWVTLEDVVDLARQGMAHLGAEELDVVSMDLDGNDYYFVGALLEAEITPKVFIVEINTVFAPPIEFKIEYDPDHKWSGDSYYGASLTSFWKLFSGHGYRLVCCNGATGANAYFVRQEFGDAFPDVPRELDEIWVPPRRLARHRYGHPPSPRVMAQILAG